MTFSKISLWAVLAAVLFSVLACTKGDDKPEVGYSSGAFIVCEGPFNSGTGTISYYNRKDSTAGDIFAAANGGAAIGNILQSYTVFQGVGYLIANNANKMVTVDPKTFAVTATYGSEFILPRYAVGVDAKRVYVSSYGKDGKDGSIKLFDIGSAEKKVSRTIQTGNGTSKMILLGGKIWAVNDGGYYRDSTIIIMSIPSDTVIEKVDKRIEVGLAPKDIVADNNGNVWVLCGGYDPTPKGTLNASTLVQIRDEKIVAIFDKLPSNASSLVLDNSKTTLYFIAGNKIYSKDPLGFNTVAPAVFLENAAFGNLYGLGVDPKTGYLFIGDAKDFTKTGQVFIYDVTTKTLKSVLSSGVGVAPNGFYFN